MTTTTTGIGESLNRIEAAQLTIDLGGHIFGDHYNNAEVWGSIANFGSRNWKANLYKKDPERFDSIVEDQIERYREDVEPYVGRVATGKTVTLGMRVGEIWEEWQVPAPFFAKGRIMGVEGHPVYARKFVEKIGGEKELAPNLRWPIYRIGVILDVSNFSIASHMRFDETVPATHTAIVPIANFPRSRGQYSGLFSNQLA